MSITEDDGKDPTVDYAPFSENGDAVIGRSLPNCFKCCQRCCFKGYFWCVVGAAYFFIIIPAGILLLVHGYHRDVPLTIGLGSAELVIFVCILPLVYLAARLMIRRRVKRARASRAQMSSRKKARAFANDEAKEFEATSVET